MSTATETVPLEALDWQPAYTCEHPHHHEDECHTDAPATHWAMSTHECFGPVGIPYPICNVYAAYLAVTPDAKGCHWCGQPSGDRWVIGPITAPAA